MEDCKLLSQSTMLKLYGGAFSRAAIVQWYLEELPLPYEFVLLDMKAGEHLAPAYREINPFGKVPAIVDGDFILWESGAILLYLAQKYGHETDQKLTIAMQWVLFANATLSSVLIEANREQEMPRLAQPLDQILQRQQFLNGAGLSVADVAVGSTLAYISMMLKVDWGEYVGIADYIQRLKTRPAFQNTISKPR
jgi:glutathione S-transferase